MLLFVILLCVAELENDSKLLYSVEVWWVGDTFCAANVRFPPQLCPAFSSIFVLVAALFVVCSL